MDKQEIIFEDLGVVKYKKAWDYQESLVLHNLNIKANARKAEQQMNHYTGSHCEILTPTMAAGFAEPSTRHHLLFCEHPPVYTLGKSGHIENVLLSAGDLEQKEIEFFRTNRGGDITFHGLQQVVGYPILDLEKFYTDLGRYLRELEEVILLTIAEYGIAGGRSKGETGVWIDAGVPGKERKICAMGIRCSRWITMHGFALNVNTDLSYFDNIIPCGITNKKVTSIERELGFKVEMEEVKDKIRANFEKVFQVTFALSRAQTYPTQE